MSLIQTLIDQHFSNFEDSVFDGKFDFYNYIMKLFQEGSSDKVFVEKLSTDLRNAFDNTLNKEKFFDIFKDIFKKVISTNISKLQQQSIRSAFQKHFGQEIAREEQKEEKKEEVVQRKNRKERKDKVVEDYERKQDNRYFFQTKIKLKVKIFEMVGGVEKEEIINVNKILNVGVLIKLCDEKEDIQNELLAALLLQYYQTGAIDKSLVVRQLETDRPVKDTKDKVLKVIVESKIRVDPNANLIDIPMKQHFKLLKQFGYTKLLNPNEGQCVIDFLESRYGSGKNSIKKALKDSNLKRIFGNNYRNEGITINQLVTFCEENQTGIYAFNDFYRLIYKKIYEESHKPLLFHIKNNQLLPIVETSLIKSFVQT